MNDLKGYIRQRSRELGIDLVGFARAGETGPEGARLAEWLSEGRHGTMAWMEKNPGRRSDPGLVMDGVKTIVSAGLNYQTPHRHPDSPGSGKISRYAWGDDYHDVLGGRLEKLLAGIRQGYPEVNGRIYVDTGPVMEKAWAQRAGLGWQGKHTNLISREHGSWLFLGEILLTAEIEPDAPETDHCGNCTLCIEACPTGAITAPYQLDARLCISYVTIEHRGPIPGDVTGRLDGWLYGCDVCQDVCPWNDRAADCGDPAFEPREGNVSRDPRTVLEMTEDEFRSTFRKSPVRRARFEGFRRNALALLDAGDTKEHTTPRKNHGRTA